MKIQSIQNQQMQSRPSFSAIASIKYVMTGRLYDGIALPTPGTTLGHPQILPVIKRLQTFISEIVRIGGISESVHYETVKSFKWGDDILELARNPKDSRFSPVVIAIKKNDGSEVQIGRENLSFRDKDFDDLTAALEAKPPAVGSSEGEIEALLDKAFSPLLQKK